MEFLNCILYLFSMQISPDLDPYKRRVFQPVFIYTCILNFDPMKDNDISKFVFDSKFKVAN